MLMNLLRTTNTLSEAKDQPHRYKVRAEGLPKFGPSAETVVRAGSAAGAKSVLEGQGGGWVQKLNPFAVSGAPIPRSAVQGELSLDNVKPLRNDLSETDLELVAAVRKPEPAPGVVRIESVDVPVVRTSSWWRRLRGVFGRGRQ